MGAPIHNDPVLDIEALELPVDLDFDDIPLDVDLTSLSVDVELEAGEGVPVMDLDLDDPATPWLDDVRELAPPPPRITPRALAAIVLTRATRPATRYIPPVIKRL